MPLATNQAWLKSYGNLPWWRSGASFSGKQYPKALGPSSVRRYAKPKNGEWYEFDPDQPRDDKGMWIGGGGSGGGENTGEGQKTSYRVSSNISPTHAKLIATAMKKIENLGVVVPGHQITFADSPMQQGVDAHFDQGGVFKIAGHPGETKTNPPVIRLNYRLSGGLMSVLHEYGHYVDWYLGGANQDPLKRNDSSWSDRTFRQLGVMGQSENLHELAADMFMQYASTGSVRGLRIGSLSEGAFNPRQAEALYSHFESAMKSLSIKPKSLSRNDPAWGIKLKQHSQVALSREPTAYEKRVDFGAIVTGLDHLEAQGLARIRALLAAARDRLLSLVGRKLGENRLTTKFVNDLELRGLGQLVPTLREVMRAAFRQGEQGARDELKSAQSGKRYDFNPDQARDDKGMWTGSGGDSSTTGGDSGSTNPSSVKGIPVTAKTLDEYIKDPQALIDFLVDTVGEDTNTSLAFRGIYEKELGKKRLRASFDSPEGVRGRQLSGTSGLLLSGDWNYNSSETIIKNINAIKDKISFYGDTPYIAVMRGRLMVDEIFNDPGEVVLSNASVVAYIPRSRKSYRLNKLSRNDPAWGIKAIMLAAMAEHPDWTGAQIVAEVKKRQDVRSYQVRHTLEGLPPEKALEFFEQKALLWGADIRDPLLSDIKNILFDAIKMGRPLRDIQAELGAAFLPWLGDPNQLIDEETLMPYRLETLVRTNVNEALNEGRKAMFQPEVDSGFITAFQFSAILDARTTEVCKYLDRRFFLPDSPEMDRLSPPRNWNCRSLWIAVTRADGPVQFIRPDEVAKGVLLSGKGFCDRHEAHGGYEQEGSEHA